MGGDDADSPDNIRGAPVDFERLELIRERLATDNRFARIDDRPEFAPDRMVCVYERRFYPAAVESAHLEIVWYENGDFSLHYHEDETFDHRWDRHPSDHNERDHVHLGPDASTPGEDTDHPTDWRDVLSMALSEIEARQRPSGLRDRSTIAENQALLAHPQGASRVNRKQVGWGGSHNSSDSTPSISMISPSPTSSS